MLATVITNQYTPTDATALADAIEELCSPNDSYGWSSSGIYCFWDTQTKEILYVGLAIDLPQRFQQHNGLLSCPETCCKHSRILEYFQDHAQLGFSIFVQSPLQQAISHRWQGANLGQLEWIAENFGFLDVETVKEDLNFDIINALRETEGAMLAVHRKDHGHFPTWNKIGGANSNFSDSRLETARYFLRSFTRAHTKHDPFMARSSLREMAKNSIIERYEMYLHGVRIHMLSFNVCMAHALEIIPDGFGDMPKIRELNYLNREPK